MDGGVAVAADGFEVGEVPGVEVEVLLAQSPLEGADAVVHLGGGREDAFGKALLAEAAVAGHHLLTQRSPSRVVVDELVAAVVLIAGLLGLRLGTKDSWHHNKTNSFLAFSSSSSMAFFAIISIVLACDGGKLKLIEVLLIVR